MLRFNTLFLDKFPREWYDVKVEILLFSTSVQSQIYDTKCIYPLYLSLPREINATESIWRNSDENVTEGKRAWEYRANM